MTHLLHKTEELDLRLVEILKPCQAMPMQIMSTAFLQNDRRRAHMHAWRLRGSF
jgi:hypothetical protein